ncbi:MAG: hypothetical protein HQ567_01770, partial [Candidatus Nealsonbacteria bacterium]|nr:hypothetical protein [Candidatus Nealsonbacteria bacterium]
FENESLYRRALALQKEGDIAGARKAIGQTDVPAVIRRYADTSQLLGISRGEQGLIVSLNLRWLTHYICLKQQLAMEPIRINFAPTSHDLLAQSRGRFTYFIDRSDRLWDVRGQYETKAPAYGDLAGRVADPPPETDDLWAVRQSGIESDQPLGLIVSPLMNHKNHKTLPGRYRLTLLFGKNIHPLDATLHIPGRAEPITEKITPSQTAPSKTFNLQLSEPGTIQVLLTPTEGKLQISGLMLEPIEE